MSAISKKASKTAIHIFLILFSLIMLYPLMFALSGMFVSVETFYEVKFFPMPQSISYFIDNLKILLKRSDLWKSIWLTMARFLWYTFFISLTSILAGYAFAKINFKFKKAAFLLLMSSMMIPGVALLVPQYQLLMQFPFVGGNNIFGKGGSGFHDNVAILFITGLFSAYNIFLFRQTISGMGNEFKEAAQVDGAGLLRIIFQIYTPMLKPVLAVVIIQLFIGQWNDYLFPMMFLSGSPDKLPIGVLAVKIQSDYLYSTGSSGYANYPMVMIMAVVMMLPPIAVFIGFQKYFIQGLSAGGIKS